MHMLHHKDAHANLNYADRVVYAGVVGASQAEHFQRHGGLSREAVGLAYSKAVEGCLSGQIFIVD